MSHSKLLNGTIPVRSAKLKLICEDGLEAAEKHDGIKIYLAKAMVNLYGYYVTTEGVRKLKGWNLPSVL